ncbi:hypothetical protein EON64_10120 [archaeon]|nr:MAG: hypothetical protein EON64_10120 [archaeon]
MTSWPVYMRLLVRTAGPLGMLVANKKIKSKYSIEDERQELFALVDDFAVQIQGPFIHGADIALEDICIYGVLRSIRNMDTFSLLMQHNAALQAWYSQVDKVVLSRAKVQ